MLAKYVQTRDARLLLKVLRYTNFLRLYLPLSNIRTLITSHVPEKDRFPGLLDLLEAVASIRAEPIVSVRFFR